MHHAGGAAALVQKPPHVGFQRGGRRHPLRPQRAKFSCRSIKDLVHFVQGRRGGISPRQPTGLIFYAQSPKLGKWSHLLAHPFSVPIVKYLV